MLARPVILDACARAPGGLCRSQEVYRMGRVLPMTLGRDPGSPSRIMEGYCRDRIRGMPLRTNMRGFPVSPELGCANLISLTIWIRGKLDFTDDMDTGDGVQWPGSDVLNIFSNSGPDPGRSFPGSEGIMKFPEVLDMMDTGPGKVSPESGWSSET